MQDRAAKPIPRRSVKRLILAHPSTRQNAACFFNGGVEPPLADMLRDPIVALVMDRDRVSADDVLSVMRAAAARSDACEG
jgi:hypothetical protein